jgi:hypothetical protein
MARGSKWRKAVRAGTGRAGLHFIRAGYEVVSGIGAVLEELNAVARKRPSGEAEEGPEKGPVRIELE